MINHRAFLLETYATGLAAVNGEQAVYNALRTQGKHEPCHIIAIGKAAEAMFKGASRYLCGNMQDALLISKYGHVSTATKGLENVQVIESGHPVPDASSLQAGRILVTYLQNLPANEAVLFLISGGTSSLVEVLAEGWTLEKLQEATQELLANGSSIHEINAMRRSLSLVKGGGLWNYMGERSVSCLLISDVSGDDPAVIGSGLLFPPAVEDFEWKIIASNRQMLAAMGAVNSVLPVFIMPDFLEGDAQAAAQACIGYLRDSQVGVYLWGAETTVKLPPNPGHGGRNQHFALAAALQLQADDTILLLAAGTDGSDGGTDDTGALVDNGTLRRGKYQNLDPVACLQAADAGTFLEASGDLIHTGPTGTNVMDVIIGLKF
jgi:hydroxypyruvate reductase